MEVIPYMDDMGMPPLEAMAILRAGLGGVFVYSQ